MKLKIKVATWNVGTAVPTKKEIELLDWKAILEIDSSTNFDILVIGFQELVSQLYAFTLHETANHWAQGIHTALKNITGNEYRLERVFNQYGIGIILFHSLDLNLIFQDAFLGVGLAGLYGNKGCIGISFVIDGHKICFLNMHLNAHEGEYYFQSRNQDLAHIFSCFKFSNNQGIQDHDYIWIMGDLNYRLNELKWRRTKGISGSPLMQYFKSFLFNPHDFRRFVISSIGNIQNLLEYDELTMLMKECRLKVLEGFREGTILFQPSYKYRLYTKKTDTLHFSQKRIPAYCDRILCKGSMITIENYGMTHTGLSDHHPIHGTFNLKLQKTSFSDSLNPSESDLRISLMRIQRFFSKTKLLWIAALLCLLKDVYL